MQPAVQGNTSTLQPFAEACSETQATAVSWIGLGICSPSYCVEHAREPIKSVVRSNPQNYSRARTHKLQCLNLFGA
eukprot:11218203-Lingulodinium_polyedra.AAC.1